MTAIAILWVTLRSHIGNKNLLLESSLTEHEAINIETE